MCDEVGWCADDEVGGVCVMKWDGEVGSWMVIYLHCGFGLFNQLVSKARQSFKNAQQLAAIIEHHRYFDYLCYQT